MCVWCLTPDAVDLESRSTARLENALGCKQPLEQTSHVSGAQKSRGELEVKSWRDSDRGGTLTLLCDVEALFGGAH